MIWACHWQPSTLCTRSMIAFACGVMVVTCSWFGFNAIIVTHLLELTFEFAPIVKDNKLSSWVMCQPGVMKQILDGCYWFVCVFENIKPSCVLLLDLSLWVQAEEKRVCFGVLAGVLIVNGVVLPDLHRPWARDTVSDSATLGGSGPYFLCTCSFFVIWHIWQVVHKQSMFNILCKIRPHHVVPDSLFCSSLSRMK
jgi:hypothetical protein